MNPHQQHIGMNEYTLTLGYDTHDYTREYINNTIGFRHCIDTLASDLETTFIFTEYRAPNLEDALIYAMQDVLEALPSAVLIHVKAD